MTKKKLIQELQSIESTTTHSACKYIKQIGSSCSLNNNCKYPNCNELNKIYNI